MSPSAARGVGELHRNVVERANGARVPGDASLSDHRRALLMASLVRFTGDTDRRTGAPAHVRGWHDRCILRCPVYIGTNRRELGHVRTLCDGVADNLRDVLSSDAQQRGRSGLASALGQPHNDREGVLSGMSFQSVQGTPSVRAGSQGPHLI